MRALQEEFHPKHLIRNLTVALIIGTFEVIFATSFATLIFSGSLTPYISTGIGLSLFTSVIVNLIIALGSSSPGILAGIQDAPTVILATMVAAISAQISIAAPTSALLPTTLTAIALTSILTGLSCFLLGQFKLGNLIRFIPYPVIGGFLAGTSWLLMMGAISFMTNLSMPGNLYQLFQPQILLKWLPGCSFSILLLVVLRYFKHFLVIPGMVIGAILLFYIGLSATQTSIVDAQVTGLLLPAFPSGSLWYPLSLSTLTQADWPLILSQIGQMFAVTLITVICILLNTTSIELIIQQDLDLNRELQAAGLANLASGLGGGILGFQAIEPVTLSYGKLGASSRIVGLLIAVMVAIVLVAGASILSFFPKFVLGGITFWLSLDLLLKWVYDAWFKLPKTDYFIVILILIIIGMFGVLEGVGVGLGAAIALFVINYSQVNVTKHIFSGASYQSNIVRSLTQARLLQEQGDRTYILDLQGFLFFGTTNTLLHQIQERLHHPTLIPLQFVVLNFQFVHGLDSSAVLSFIKLKQLFEPRGIKLVFTHLSPAIYSQMKRGDCFIPDDPVCQVFPDLDRGLEWCENEILSQVSFRRTRSLPLVLQLNTLFSNHDYALEFMNYLEKFDTEKGDLLFQQNQPADFLYLIELGQVTVYLDRQPGQSSRIQTLRAGNLIGEQDFFRNSTYQISARVDAPSTLYRLSNQRFQQMQQEKPEVAVAFQSIVIKILSDRLTGAYKEIADLLRS